jgi:hypothetical protein
VNLGWAENFKVRICSCFIRRIYLEEVYRLSEWVLEFVTYPRLLLSQRVLKIGNIIFHGVHDLLLLHIFTSNLFVDTDKIRHIRDGTLEKIPSLRSCIATRILVRGYYWHRINSFPRLVREQSARVHCACVSWPYKNHRLRLPYIIHSILEVLEGDPWLIRCIWGIAAWLH